MAKTTEAQWIPSGGVLAVAIGAALVAAILVNLYVGYARSAYENGAKDYLVLKTAVGRNDPIQETNLVGVKVPKKLESQFTLAIVNDPAGRAVIVGKKAPRNLSAGEFLWYPEFTNDLQGQVFQIPPDCEIVTIMINPQPLGQQLQPGGYVALHGEFNYSSSKDTSRADWRPLVVMDSVQAKALGGSTEPVAVKARTYDNIQIMLKKSQVQELMQIIEFAKDHRFTLGVVANQEVNANPPVFTKDIRDFMTAKQNAAVTGTAPGKMGGPITLPPDEP